MSRSVTMSRCPIGRAVEILGERWTLLIMRNAPLNLVVSV
jgi:DNA-binding HxlR family transcriptional regulator